MRNYTVFSIFTIIIMVTTLAYGNTQKTVMVGENFSFNYTDYFGLTGEKYETSFTITPATKKCIQFVGTVQIPKPQHCYDCSSSTRWDFKAKKPGQQTITFTRKREHSQTLETESHEITIIMTKPNPYSR